MLRTIAHLLLIAVATLAATACREPERPPSFTIATTTSVDNSGLLRHLADTFTRETGLEPRWIAVGSGKALQMGAEARVDVVISHDPEREKQFVGSGHASLHEPFARNDFILIGPPSNPAGVAAGDSAAAAFAKIFESGSRFVSRSDSSGTHAREILIWKEAGITPGGDTYFQMGQSMSALLRSARELDAYTLTDRATFLQVGDRRTQRVVLDRDPMFRNVYSVILPRQGTSTENAQGARRFAEWLISESGQKSIAAFRIRGAAAFTPAAGRP